MIHENKSNEELSTVALKQAHDRIVNYSSMHRNLFFHDIGQEWSISTNDLPDI